MTATTKSAATDGTLTIGDLRIPGDVHTLDGFRRWASELAENAPMVSFYRGEVHIEMNQDYFTHEPVAAAICRKLADLTDELGIGRFFMAPSWFTDDGAGISTEPDGFLVLWSSFDEGRVRVEQDRPRELQGHPDMVLEVVSKTSVRKDAQVLMEGYARAGVAEYWLADARGTEPALELHVPGSDGGYSPRSADADGWIASPIFGRSFRLHHFTDRAGLPAYRLEVREKPPRARRSRKRA